MIQKPKTITAVCHSTDVKGVTLPIINGTPMPLVEGAELLLNLAKDQETMIAPNAKFDFTTHEGKVALARVRATYGQSLDKASMGMFGPVPPGYDRVVVGPDGDTVDVPTGEFTIPGIEGKFRCGEYLSDDGQVCFLLQAMLKKKHQPDWDRLCREVEEEVKTNSIYKGQAFELEFIEYEIQDERGSRTVLMPGMPKYLRLPKTPADPVFPEYLKAKLDMNTVAVFENPTAHVQRMNELGLPPSRKVCVYGHPGCGKTMQVLRAAQAAQKNGRTYIRAKAERIVEVLRFAKRFQDKHQAEPVGIEFEDIDRAYQGERDANQDSILNTVDGSVSKDDFFVILMTSNNVDAMHGAALRAGRMDVLVEIGPPPAAQAAELIRRTLKSHLDPQANLVEVAKLVHGWLPASIAELCVQARMFADYRTGEVGAQVTAEDLVFALSDGGLQAQVDRVLTKPTVVLSAVEKGAAILAKALQPTTTSTQEEGTSTPSNGAVAASHYLLASKAS